MYADFYLLNCFAMSLLGQYDMEIKMQVLVYVLTTPGPPKTEICVCFSLATDDGE